MRSRTACVLAAVAVAATPSAAFAQGAGDDQYTDPFGSEEQAPAQTPAPSAPEPEPAPATPAPPAGAGAESAQSAPATPAPSGGGASGGGGAATAPAAPVATAQERLPYTGTDAGLVGAAGAALMLGGIALRVRLRADA